MINLLGISGKKQSGKDTVCKIIQWFTEPKEQKNWEDNILSFLEVEHASGFTWQKKAFAWKVKMVAEILTGVSAYDFDKEEIKRAFLGNDWNYNAIIKSTTKEPGSGKMTGRELLQFIGTDAMRDNVHPNCWVNALFSEYNTNPLPNWIVTDVRFPNELQAIKQRSGVIVRVNRTDLNSNDKHLSETALDDAEFDYTINCASGIENLIIETKKMLQYFNIIE